MIFKILLKQFKSNFVTYELSPGIYTIQGILETVYTMGVHKGTLEIEYNDISIKTKLSLAHFGGTFGRLRVDEKSIFKSLMGFSPNWSCKLTNAIHAESPGVYSNEKILNLGTIEKST